MAERRNSTSEYRYRSNGSAALRPEVTQERKQQRQPRTQQRKNYRLRQQERISPFGVIGLLAVAVVAAMVISTMVKLNAVNKELVQASNQLTALQSSYDDLYAAYEQTFDLADIESDMLASGSMVKASESQRVYMNLSEDDTVEVYGKTDENKPGPIRRGINAVLEFLGLKNINNLNAQTETETAVSDAQAETETAVSDAQTESVAAASEETE